MLELEEWKHTSTSCGWWKLSYRSSIQLCPPGPMKEQSKAVALWLCVQSPALADSAGGSGSQKCSVLSHHLGALPCFAQCQWHQCLCLSVCMSVCHRDGLGPWRFWVSVRCVFYQLPSFPPAPHSGDEKSPLKIMCLSMCIVLQPWCSHLTPRTFKNLGNRLTTLRYKNNSLIFLIFNW